MRINFSLLKIILLNTLLFNTYIYAQQGWGFRNLLPQGSVYQLDFLNINTGYGVCDKGIIIKTTNGGNTWLLFRSLTGRNLYSCYFFNLNSGYAIGDSGTIIYSSNAGVNWIIRNSGVTESLNSITFVNSNTGFIAGNSGKVLKTTNGGLNWQYQTIGTNQLNNIFFLNTNTGYIAGSGGLFAKTTNAGNNWVNYIIDTTGNRSVYFTSTDTGYISCSKSIYRTVNGGMNWINICSLYYNNSDVYSMKFINSQTGYCVGKNLPILKTVDAGLSWGMEVTGVYGPYIYYDINLIDTVKYISGTDGYILKSSLNVTWQTIGGTKHNINSIALADYNNISGAADNQTLMSTNTGVNWKIDTYGTNNFFEPISTTFKQVKFFGPNNGYRTSRTGGGGTGIYTESVSRSTNGGVSWDAPGGWYGGWFTEIHDFDAVDNITFLCGRDVSQGGFIMKSVSGSNWVTQYTYLYDTYYYISFANADTGIAYAYNSNSGNCIVRTTNGGSNWSRHTLPTGYNGRLQLLNPSQGLMISYNGTVYRSSNTGINWYTQDTGLGYIRGFKFVNANKGWAVGENGLILYSTNGGYNWNPQQSNITLNLNSVSFIDELNGVIGGDSGIVLKTTNGGITFVNITVDPIPGTYSLMQNYPNPFNPVTYISFDLPENAYVKLTIYDINGREITKLIDNYLYRGSLKFIWDGSGFASGVYFYKIETEKYTASKKMVLIK